MKRCDDEDECYPVCNHCIYMSGWEWDNGFRCYKGGIGYCDFHRKDTYPDALCDEFHCFRAKIEQVAPS
jgi:hypothetical protein